MATKPAIFTVMESSLGHLALQRWFRLFCSFLLFRWSSYTMILQNNPTKGGPMRPICFVIATVLIASSLTAAAWKVYPQRELGFLVEFPGDPSESTGRYHTGLVQSATAHIFSLKDDQ